MTTDALRRVATSRDFALSHGDMISPSVVVSL